MKANIKIDHQLLAVQGEHTVHAMLELQAPAITKEARPPLHLALVIDRSGSMTRPKLDYTKAAAEYLIRRLEPTEQLALVAHDDTVAPLTRGQFAETRVPDRREERSALAAGTSAATS